MAFLIRSISRTKTGKEIKRDRLVEASSLSIGRAPENSIVLTDLVVEQNHLTITDQGGGRLSVEAGGERSFEVDGVETHSATINAESGGEITVGPASFAISIDRNAAGASGPPPILVIFSQKHAAAAADDGFAGFGLASALPSKRVMAWSMTATILLLLLAVPIVTNLLRTPVENDPENLDQGQVVLDSAWSAGDLSLKHHELEGNCEACHVTPFVSVQDETCLTCHDDLGLGDHAAMDRLRAGMAPLSTGDAIQWSIAETLGKEGPLGCVSCHNEHEGQVRTEPATEQFCSDCHNDLDARLTDVSFGNAADFGSKHPQFRPAIYTAHFADAPTRVSLDQNPVEESGLKFTHDQHMDDQGGVARMAISLARYGAPLECSDCHSEWSEDELEAAVRSTGGVVADFGDFAPVNMEAACESCHSLVFDQVGSQFRSLSHGDVREVMAELATMDRGPRRAVVSGRSRPGQFARGGRYHSNFGRPMGSYIAINRALDRGGVCSECHIPTVTDGRRDLTPVNLPHRFLLSGAFNHDAHGEDVAECTECHATSQSSSATDLLIPDLESCRDCHQGATAIETEEITPSGCAMCHAYHTPSAPWRPDDHPNLPENEDNETVAALLGSLRR